MPQVTHTGVTVTADDLRKIETVIDRLDHNDQEGALDKLQALVDYIVGEYRKGQASADPDPALLASMATCMYHGFGMLDFNRQQSMLHDMRKLWDEVMGRGYYQPSNRDRYLQYIADAPEGS